MNAFIDRMIVRYGTERTNWAGGYEITRTWIILGREVKFAIRTSDGMGRFGGGWNYELGFVASASTVILNCLVFFIRINLKKKEIKP